MEEDWDLNITGLDLGNFTPYTGPNPWDIFGNKNNNNGGDVTHATQPDFVLPGLNPYLEVRKPIIAAFTSICYVIGVTFSVLNLVWTIKRRSSVPLGYLVLTGSLMTSCLLYIAICGWFLITKYQQFGWSLSAKACKIYHYFFNVIYSAVVCHVTVLPVYWCLTSTGCSRILNKKLIVAFGELYLWMICLAVNTTMIVWYGLITPLGGGSICQVEESRKLTFDRYNLYVFVVVPLTVQLMSIIFSVVYISRRRHERWNIRGTLKRRLRGVAVNSITQFFLLLLMVAPHLVFQIGLTVKLFQKKTTLGYLFTDDFTEWNHKMYPTLVPFAFFLGLLCFRRSIFIHDDEYLDETQMSSEYPVGTYSHDSWSNQAMILNQRQ